MKTTTTSAAALPGQSALTSAVAGAWETVGQSFDQFCLLAGFSALGEMMAADVTVLAGEAHARDTDRPGYRWGRTCGRLGFHGGKVELERSRVRSKVTWEGICPAWLAGGWRSRMVGRMGAESDADERGHAQVRASRAPGRGRCAVRDRLWPFQIGRLPAFQGADGGAVGRVDDFGPVAARPFGDPDRRAPYDRQAADDRRRRH